ncbi:putative ribonuclease H-like domain-containing protein, partial [Tanacetum coccineum]
VHCGFIDVVNDLKTQGVIVNPIVNADGIEVNAVDPKSSIKLPNGPNMSELEDIVYSNDDEDVGAEADINYLDAFMLRGKIDKNLFIRRVKSDILLVQVYVDDIIFGSTKKKLCTKFEKMLLKKFQMSSMGELTIFLGLQIASTPMETHKPLLKDANGEDVDEQLYRSMNGSLMYLTSSRPDIMFAVLRSRASSEETMFRSLKDKALRLAYCIRDSNKKKLIQMIKIHTDQNVTDLLTKAFDVSRFQYLIAKWNEKAAKDEIGNVDSMVNFWMYPRFVQVFMNKQVGDMSYHKRIYVASSDTKKIFRNMKRERKGFSGRVTPLFKTMMVQAHEEMDEGSEIPTDPHQTPIITQPSSSQSQRKQKSRKSKKNNTEVPQPCSSTDNVPDENVPTTSNDPLLSGEDRLKLTKLMDLCTNLQKKVLDLEKAKTNQDSEITSLKKKVKKLEMRNKSRTPGLKRLRKVGSAKRVESSGEASLGDQDDASKQRKKIDEIDVDVEVTLIDETQGRNDDNLMKLDVQAKRNYNNNYNNTSCIKTFVRQKRHQGKEKKELIESEKPLKKKDQIMYDQEVALNLQSQLQAKLEKEERLTRQKEKEANIALIES